MAFAIKFLQGQLHCRNGTSLNERKRGKISCLV